MGKKLIQFDWALKKLLRHKANFDILEGLLSELLRFDVKIESILESEGNQQYDYDKYNRVDILVKSESGELMLVEVQNDPQADYFHRMLYGISKLITEYIKQGETYGAIKKAYSINIVYFGLGQGTDYVYEYKGEFVGLHQKDTLMPTSYQMQKFNVEKVSDIFPKYYVLNVKNFNNVARNTLDEWMYFLKNSEVKDEFKAKGLDVAREKLHYENLSDEEKAMYNRHQENKRIEKSVTETVKQEGRKEGKRETLVEIAKNMITIGLDNETIAKATELPFEYIDELRQETT